MASTLVAMASTLLAMASTLVATASNLIAIWTYYIDSISSHVSISRLPPCPQPGHHVRSYRNARGRKHELAQTRSDVAKRVREWLHELAQTRLLVSIQASPNQVPVSPPWGLSFPLSKEMLPKRTSKSRGEGVANPWGHKADSVQARRYPCPAVGSLQAWPSKNTRNT